MNPGSLKIIFQDVDGCLNPADGEDFGAVAGWEPSAQQVEMLQAINRAVEASPVEHFIINTGRYLPILECLTKHLTTPKLRYLVMEHACVIHDRATGENLDPVALAHGCGMAELAGRYADLDTVRKLLAWYDTRGQQAMEHRYGVPMPRLDKLANLSYAIPPGVDGAGVLELIESLAREDFSRREFECLEFCRSDRFIDILPGIHKMDGIELMCAHLGVEKSNALAVGDFLNDLPVFESFDQVMCPANAHPRIRELAQSKGRGGHVSAFSYGTALIDFLGQMRAAESGQG